MTASTEVSETIGLGRLLVRSRHARARSQQRLAEQLCAMAGVATVSRHEISRWERGERIPSPYWLACLSVVLDVPLADLERAVAHSKDRRLADVAPRRSRTAVPSWPWRLIVAYAVATPGGGIQLRSPPPLDWRPGLGVHRRARPPGSLRDRLRSSRESNSDGPS